MLVVLPRCNLVGVTAYLPVAELCALAQVGHRPLVRLVDELTLWKQVRAPSCKRSRSFSSIQSVERQTR